MFDVFVNDGMISGSPSSEKEVIANESKALPAIYEMHYTHVSVDSGTYCMCTQEYI